MWAACDAHDTPQAFLVGSANLTIAGLHENVELMAQAGTASQRAAPAASTGCGTHILAVAAGWAVLGVVVAVNNRGRR